MRTMRTRPRRAALFTLVVVGALVAAPGCDDQGPIGPPKPVPGTLTLRLVTPHADDRAILVRVTGPRAMTEVAAAAGYTVHARPTSADGTAFRAAAFGDLAGGTLLTFAVPDVNLSAQYAATVVEASDAANALRSTLAGYRLTITR